jgi:hypothetical protein
MIASERWATTAASERLEPTHEDGCDGIHDEGAPDLYLCTRCFPYGRGGDLSKPDDNDQRCDEEEEID